MKPIIYPTVLLIFAGFQKAQTTSEKDRGKKIGSNTIRTMHVGGITCTGYEKTIENKSKGIEGVVSAKADHNKGLTTVTFDSTVNNKSMFVDRIQ